MSSEQDKRPSLVPLGVFGTTSAPPPPPPAAATSPGVVAAPVPAATEQGAASPEAGGKPSDDRPSFPRTLVGVPSLSPEAARARRGDFPAPPKWQGAAAYAAGAPALRTGTGAPVPPGAQPPRPPPSSALSASAPPPVPAGPPAPFPLAKDAPVLGRVNLRSVAAAVPTVGGSTRPAGPPARGDDTEQELDLRDAIEEAGAAHAPVATAPSAASARPAETGHGAGESAPAPAQPTTRSSIPPVIVPDFARKDPSEVNIPLPAPVPVVETPGVARGPVVGRPVPAPRPAVEVDPGAPLLGVMFVSAMLVLGVGGWWLTRGGFVRPRHPEVVASAGSTDKKPTPSQAPPAEVKVAAPEPEPEPEAEPEAAAPAVSPTVPTEPAAAAGPVVERRAPGGGAELRARRAQAPARPAPPVRPVVEPPAGPAPQLTITPTPESRPPPAAPVPSGPMTDTPTREDVTRALDAVRSRLVECAGGKHGVAEVDLTVLATGDVSHVVVTGDFAGSAEGSCIAREVRAARFSPFLKPRFRLIYPFQL